MVVCLVIMIEKSANIEIQIIHSSIMHTIKSIFRFEHYFVYTVSLLYIMKPKKYSKQYNLLLDEMNMKSERCGYL